MRPTTIRYLGSEFSDAEYVLYVKANTYFAQVEEAQSLWVYLNSLPWVTMLSPIPEYE